MDHELLKQALDLHVEEKWVKDVYNQMARGANSINRWYCVGEYGERSTPRSGI